MLLVLREAGRAAGLSSATGTGAGCAREGQGEALAGLQTCQGTQRAEEQLLQHSVLVPSVMLSPVSHSATSNTSGT